MDFEEWLRRNQPDNLDDKLDLLRVLREPAYGQTYSSKADGSSLTVSKGANWVRLPDQAAIDRAITMVEELDLPDPDNLGEGYKGAMGRKSNNR